MDCVEVYVSRCILRKCIIDKIFSYQRWNEHVACTFVHPLSFSDSPSAFLSLVHVIQFLEFNDEPSKKHYSLNACTTHYTLYMYLKLYIQIGTLTALNVLVLPYFNVGACIFAILSSDNLPFWAIWNFVFEHISSDVSSHFMHHKNLVHSKLSPKFHTVCFVC